MPLPTTVALPSGASILGSATFPVSASPLGAVIFVNSTGGVDSRGRLKFFGSAAVSPTQGSQQGPVGDPGYPLASVFGTAGALSFCKANRGDIIVVLPGHTENLSVNGSYGVVAGVSIIGIGYGNSRPKFTLTGGTATTIGSGAGAQFNNLIFDLTGVASVVSGFTFANSGIQFVGCRIILSGATNKATTAITLNAGADDFVFTGGNIDASGAAGSTTNGILTGSTVNRPEITNNFFYGSVTAGFIVAANANPMVSLVIQNNEFINTGTGAALACMTLGNASTGTVAYNDLFVGGTTSGVGSSMVGTPTSTGVIWIQNFGYNNVANKGGNLVPAAGAALT